MWADDTNMHRRDRALFVVLALGVLRRSEAAVMRYI